VLLTKRNRNAEQISPPLFSLICPHNVDLFVFTNRQWCVGRLDVLYQFAPLNKLFYRFLLTPRNLHGECANRGPMETAIIANTRTCSKSCIQGHRSSSCAHANRPLFEIKKKGRPISQCEECRELRQNKRVHSKCKCRHGKGDEQSGTQSLTPGGKRVCDRRLPPNSH